MPRSLSARGTYWSSRRIPPAPSPFGTRSSSHSGRTLRRIPPPPPIPSHVSGTSGGRSASTGSRHNLAAVGIDETGRQDMSGRPIGFYPAVHGTGKLGGQTSAMKTSTSTPPPQNAQQNPFFVDPIQKPQTGR